MPLIPAGLARTLAVSLDGRTLGSWVLGPGTSDDEVLVELGEHLVNSIAGRVGPDEPLDPGSLDEPEPESAEDPPAAAQPIESPHVSSPAPAPPIAESAENGTVRDPAAPPEMSAKPPVTDTTAAPVAVSGTEEPQHVGDAERGQATEAAVRAWARKHDVPCSATGALKAWVRAEYERLGGDPPDFRSRRMAREVGGATFTTPTVDPDVAMPDTIRVWLVRNGLEDRLPPTPAGLKAYRMAWDDAHAAHPQPPAGSPAAAGQDPPTPERAGRADRASGRSTPVEPTPSVRPAVEPVGDGTDQPASRPEQLERADELAADGKTPRQIMAETGVWLAEARAAVRRAAGR